MNRSDKEKLRQFAVRVIEYAMEVTSNNYKDIPYCDPATIFEFAGECDLVERDVENFKPILNPADLRVREYPDGGA